MGKERACLQCSRLEKPDTLPASIQQTLESDNMRRVIQPVHNWNGVKVRL